MSRRRVRGTACVVQPMLALGHAEVRWEALPVSVQGEVLARWCEMLHDAMRTARETTHADEVQS